MTPQERLVEVAGWYIGVREATGHNDGVNVEEFQKAVDGKASGESWCCCFVQFCVKAVCQDMGVSTTLFQSEHCLTMWGQSSNRVIDGESVQPGYIVVWQHAGTTNGHTGIVTAVDGEQIHTIEGNTGNGEEVNPDGDGVYSRVRNIHGSGSMRVVGFINPF